MAANRHTDDRGVRFAGSKSTADGSKGSVTESKGSVTESKSFVTESKGFVTESKGFGNESKSFVTEALIISLSNFIVKIIGVLFKIPMTYMLGVNMGIFNAAYSIYAMLFMLSTAGLPVAISRLVAVANEKGRPREIRRVYRLSVYMFGLIGLFCSFVLFFGAEAIGAFSEHREAALAMKVISPTLFLICISSAIRGYFQGLKNMFPTAISQFIEAFFKLSVGLGAVAVAGSLGASPAVQAACGISGLTVGVLLGTVFLLFCKKRHDTSVSRRRGNPDADAWRVLARRIAIIAVPVTITSSALYLSQFLDTLVINRALIATGTPLDVAERLYSAYTTYAVPLSDLLPSTLVYPIAISILPTVSAALAVKKYKKAKYYIVSSLRISGIIALPCSFGLAVLARPSIALIFGNGGIPIETSSGSVYPIDIAAPALSILSLGIVLISLLSTANALLQACRRSYLPMLSVGAGVVLLVIAEIGLVSIPAVGIYGAPISTLICYAVALGFNMHFLSKTQRLRLNVLRMFAKPAFCAALSAACAFGTYRLVYALLGSESRPACALMLIASVAVAVAVYVITMLAVRGIRENEVRLLPCGNRFADYLIRKGMLRPNEKRS